MSVDIFVERSPADSQGEDIIEPLLGAQPEAINRGRNELDTRASLKQPVVASIVFRTGLAVGQLIEVHNELEAEVFRGKLVRLSHRLTPQAALTSTTIERPL